MTVQLNNDWKAVLDKWQTPPIHVFCVDGTLRCSSEPIHAYLASGLHVPSKAELRRIYSHDPATLTLELVVRMDSSQTQQDSELQTVNLPAIYSKQLDTPEDIAFYERYTHVSVVHQGAVLIEIPVRHFSPDEGFHAPAP
jgi:hypothetical protein